jgi:phage protein D
MSSDVMAIGRRIMVLLGFGDSEQVPYARWTVSHPKVTGRPTEMRPSRKRLETVAVVKSGAIKMRRLRD